MIKKVQESTPEKRKLAIPQSLMSRLLVLADNLMDDFRPLQLAGLCVYFFMNPWDKFWDSLYKFKKLFLRTSFGKLL